MVCVERKELSKNAVSAVQNVNAARSLASQQEPEDLASAQTVERQALEQLVMHRRQHGC